MPQDLDNAKYVSFGTYKRDGTLVEAPVWIVPFEDGYAFTTDSTSFKVKRLGRDPRVTVAVSNFRGRIADGTTRHIGTGEVLSPERAQEVQRLVRRKYGIAWLVTLGPSRLMNRLRGREQTTGEGAIAFVVTGATDV
ncbi:MAG: PPOX class F420-dependent oxidoreductase [Actinomycetes bacterium]